MLLASLAIAHLVVTGAGPRGNYEVSARAEARPRSTLAGDQATGSASADAQFNARMALLLTGAETTFGMLYAPQLLVREPQLDARPQMLHRAGVELTRMWRPSSSLSLRLGAAKGRTEFSLLNGSPSAPGTTPLPPTQALPLLRSVRFVEWESSLHLALPLSLRLNGTASAGVGMSGGADTQAQLLLPLQKGGHAAASAVFSASRVDTLTSQLTASHASFSSGQRASVASLTESWRHAFSRSTGGQLTLGLSGARNQLLTGGEGETLPAAFTLFPAGGVEVTHAWGLRGHRLLSQASVLLLPSVDPFTGRVLQRLDGGVGSVWRVGTSFALSLRARAAQVVSSGAQANDRSALLDLSAELPLHPSLQFEAGVRNSWQASETYAIPNPYQWLVFVAVNVGKRGRF